MRVNKLRGQLGFTLFVPVARSLTSRSTYILLLSAQYAQPREAW